MSYMRGAGLLFFMLLGYAGLCRNGPDRAESDYRQFVAFQSDTVSAEHHVDSAEDESALSSLWVNLQSLDSVIRRVDPLVLFPNLASMGTVTMPKGYVFMLVAFVATGGILIFVADVVRMGRRRSRARRRRRHANRAAGAFKMQVAFEAFVVTLFDPKYFRYQHKWPQSVLMGASSKGEVPADLEFEFDYRDVKARFTVKCLYFTSVSKGDVQLFYSTRNEWQGARSELPVYFILGFGGKPDDPQELFLLPAEVAKRGVIRKDALAPYSKSGMFFYNVTTGRLQ